MTNRAIPDAVGNCYQQALYAFQRLLMKGATEVRLVHGLVTGTGGQAEGIRYHHAWVEIDGRLCLDFMQNGQTLMVPKAIYYQVGGILEDEVVRYDREAVRDHLLGAGHSGPWRDVPDPFFVDAQPADGQALKAECGA